MFKNINRFLANQATSIFYSLAITVGIFISIQELYLYNNITNFVAFSIAILLIYTLELFTSYQNKSSKVELNLDINDDVNELSHLFHKIILPVILYLAIVGFGYYNYSSSFLLIILGITFLIFMILFVNTKAFLQNKISVEHKTHYVYDIIKILTFFLLINTLSNAYRSSERSLIYFTILSIAVTFIILLLMLWRIEKIRKKTILYSLFAASLIGLIFQGLHSFLTLNPLQLSLSMIFLFYILSAIIHHRLMGTLTRSVLMEYGIVIFLVLAITYGIT